MKTPLFILLLAAFATSPSQAQAPYSPPEPQPASPPPTPAAQSAAPSATSGGGTSGGQQSDKTLFGNELPMMDPSNNTVRFQGATFDLANNGLVRARFEKYLNTPPESSRESSTYRALIEKMLKESRRRNRFDGPSLVAIGKALYEATEYPGDGNQCGALANAILSVIDTNRLVRQRVTANKALDQEIRQLGKQRNRWANQNTTVSERYKKRATHNEMAILDNTKREAKNEAMMAKNELANEAAGLNAKIQYQSLLLQFLVQRRFDHAVLGARIYRLIFTDGDTTLRIKEGSQAGKIFSDVAGMPPTVALVDSVSNNIRHDVDESIEAVRVLLSQDKLGAATERMAEAFALGEFMQSVSTFPLKEKQRIAEYWQCRKDLLAAVNNRDYGKAESLVERMHKLDQAFDDSLPMSYITAQKNASDLALRNAAKALADNDDAKFNEEIAKAASIWPRNPKIETSKEQLEEFDRQDAVKDEFRSLLSQKNYRFICQNKDKYARAVFNEPELKAELERVMTTVAEIDKTIEAIREIMSKDTTFGVYMAYEKITGMVADNEDFAADREMQNMVLDVTLKAQGFHTAIEEALARENDGEYGSALAGYLQAQAMYPASDKAKDGIRRVTDTIMKAKY